MLLAADIGGTKAVFALFDIQEGKPFLVVDRTYSSQGIASLGEIVLKFLDETAQDRDGQEILGACFAIAAPVYGSTYTFSNLALTVHPAQVRKQLSSIPQIDFINDLEALGHWILAAEEQDCFCLYAGRPVHKRQTILNKAIIAPGTGLGEALVMAGKDVYPTEGGHADYAPQTDTEIELLRFLQKDYEHVSYERLLSGPGLLNIYRFLCWQRREPLTEPLPSPEEISKRGLTGECPTCQDTLELFTRILGAEAGNLALKALAFGGIYLGGGIPPKILPKLREGTFLQSFLHKGRFTTLVEKVPVYVILDEQAALQGAAWCDLKKLGRC
ncbi:MAG: glucokinase [Bacillota bacterium]|nr:glucokinase [Bacillota bacterium]